MASSPPRRGQAPTNRIGKPPANRPGQPPAKRSGKPPNRRGKPPATPSGQAPTGGSSATDERGPRKGRRRRSGAKGVAPAAVAARALGAAKEEARPDKSVEGPLTAHEVATLKRHFQFLKGHRKILNLKVNAQEDLLLNGEREPEHRGVCQHLLGKVDRKRVFSAVERLDPAAASKLVEGVLLIAPDVDFVLLYLDCVRREGARDKAVQALTEALERIDFGQVSQGQMRRVLDLIVELFDERQRPQMLLGLLRGKSFRQSFDQSAEHLPEALRELVVPLRAAQGAILAGKKNPFGTEALRAGVRFLLQADESTLNLRDREGRRRLLNAGLDLWPSLDDGARRSVGKLLDGFQGDAEAHREGSLRLCRRLIASGAEKAARRRLAALATAHPTERRFQDWLVALDAPRARRIALRERRGKGPRSGLHLDGLRDVWLVFGADHDAVPGLFGDRVVPGVATIVDRGEHDGAPYYAVLAHGTPLDVVVTGREAPGRSAALALCRDLVAIVAGLAALGVSLPDVRLRRFERDDAGALWLVHLAGATTANDGGAGMLEATRGECLRLLTTSRAFVLDQALEETVESAPSFPDLHRALVRAHVAG